MHGGKQDPHHIGTPRRAGVTACAAERRPQRARCRLKPLSAGAKFLLAVTLAFGALPANAVAVHQVGPERSLKLPSDAAEIVQDGDIVRIDPGEYVDCAIWRASGLLLQAPDGAAHVRDRACAGKAIWVISGDDVTVDNITFSGARVPHRNGAGIRAEGRNLTVRNARFYDNENGILGGTVESSTIRIEDSVFERNGTCERDCAHGVYVNAIERLEITRSTFREQRVGHHVKSRARALTVSDSTIEDGPDGTASYLIDVWSASEVTIANNFLQKGPESENRGTALHIAGRARSGALYRIVGNCFENDGGHETALVRNRTGVTAILKGNRIEGPGVALVGRGTVGPAPGDRRRRSCGRQGCQRHRQTRTCRRVPQEAVLKAEPRLLKGTPREPGLDRGRRRPAHSALIFLSTPHSSSTSSWRSRTRAANQSNGAVTATASRLLKGTSPGCERRATTAGTAETAAITSALA
jgi:hypothetical protein